MSSADGNKIKIYLCDLVHTYLGIGSYMFPLNIGYIAAYANKFFSERVDITLFKYPEEFMVAVKQAPPDIAGFSNYVWNANLNHNMAKWVKLLSKNTIVVFGGPNINQSEKGYKTFFGSNGDVDFYVPLQGETPFVELLERIFSVGKDASSLKTEPIDGVIFNSNGSVVAGKALERIRKVDEVPSPYLTGLLDKFFDYNLIPIVETNRGCPYSCTFCAQGIASRRIDFFSIERVKEELSYIAGKVKKTNILNLADSNFGIVPRDMEIAGYIAELRRKTGYPRKVNTNWAKNQPKLYEISKILNDVTLIVSLQSLDDNVLRTVKRTNTKTPVFRNIMNEVNETGRISGTEIILGLPGETKESHLETLRRLFDFNVSYIICYNALLLNGTEMSLARESGEFRPQTKFRLIDGFFGKYGDIMSFDVEEGIRSTAEISEEEILYFRPVHWLIQFLWNYRFYYELLRFLQSNRINPLDYIAALVSKESRANAPSKIREILDAFDNEARAEWFDSPEALRAYYSEPSGFELLKAGKFGKMNGKYVFKVLLEAREDFEKYLYDVAVNFLPDSRKRGALEDIMSYLSNKIIDFRKDFDSFSKPRTISFKYDILGWRDSRYKKSIEDLHNKEGIEYVFYLPEDQRKALEVLLKQYRHEDKNVTLRKMSEFMNIMDLFLKVKSDK